MSRIKSIFVRDLFNDKVALVTGGGSGIGFRTAIELAILGCTVIIAGRQEPRLIEAAREIEQQIQLATSKGRVFYHQLNIRDSESREACINWIKSEIGKLDYLVNNAGGQFPTVAEDCSEKGWKSVIDLNLSGTFLMSRDIMNEFFMERKSGVIVNVIADMWKGFPTMVHTGAARAAVHNITQTLAIEWAKYGVRVLSVAPGTIDSSGLKSYGEGMQAFLQESKKFNYAYRFGTEEEVAAGIIFLLSPASAFTTGTTLKIDGAGSIYHPLSIPSGSEDLFPRWADSKL